jgi:hypothetical protein
MRTLLITLSIFVLISGVFSQDVIISEINYNSFTLHDTEDWLEFYNPASLGVEMSGWEFKDANDTNVFVFPSPTILDGESFLVLCRDTAAFTWFFPGVHNIIGEFDFRLSNGGEHIRLFDATGHIVDSLTYDDAPPWPTEPDGQGPTLELIDPSLPGHEPSSWQTSTEPYGTPGDPNEGWDAVLPEPSLGALPGEYDLSPAYPNPFNPNTWLSFSLPKAEEIAITVYNLEGAEIAKLAEGWLMAGKYRVNFDAAYLPSGVYIATMKAADFQQSQKLLLVR